MMGRALDIFPQTGASYGHRYSRRMYLGQFHALKTNLQPHRLRTNPPAIELVERFNPDLLQKYQTMIQAGKLTKIA